jgi:hypothetical protein
MPRNKVRDQRTINPFRPKPIEVGDAIELQRTVNSRGWDVALDLMEMCVIEADTSLVNCPVEDEKKILGQHKVAKAAWTFFVEFQKKIKVEVEKALLHDVDANTPPPAPKREADIL